MTITIFQTRLEPLLVEVEITTLSCYCLVRQSLFSKQVLVKSFTWFMPDLFCICYDMVGPHSSLTNLTETSTLYLVGGMHDILKAFNAKCFE